MDNKDEQNMQFMMFSDQPGDEIEYLPAVTVKAIFAGPNSDKNFRFEIEPTKNPIGLRVCAYGDSPPNPVSEAIIGYIMKEAAGIGEAPLYAVGEILFNACLDYVEHYYVKLPYVPDSSGNSRFWIQCCGTPGDRHWHVIELDDVTKKPVNLLRDMNHTTTTRTLGAALQQCAGHIFEDFSKQMRSNSIHDLIQDLIGKKPRWEETEPEHTETEANEEPVTSTDILQRMWDVGPNDDDE